MIISPLIDPYSLHYDSFTSDVYTIDTASITLTAGTLTASKSWVQKTGTGARFFLDRTDGRILFLTGGAGGSDIYYDTDSSGELAIYKCSGVNIRDETFTGAVKVWVFDNDDHFLPFADSTYDIGKSDRYVDDIYANRLMLHANAAIQYITTGTPDKLTFASGGTTALEIGTSAVFSVQVSGSDFNIDGGTLSGITIDGNWTAAGQTCADLGTISAATSITTSALVATTAEINGALNHDGSTAGFYGTTPITQQTGVVVSAAAIHAALVNLGLITA